MNSWLLLIAGICYLVTCCGNLCQKDYAHALVFFAYFVANLGLIWHELNKIGVQ